LRIIDRAKWILISSMKMSEQEAHRYIEKQAMDIRSSRRFVAEGILKRYES
jgi:two-component system, response regulator PdtaR